MKIGNVQKKRMVWCLENLFYREKVKKLNVFVWSKYSLGDDFLDLKSRKHWCEKSSNSKLLKPINLLILTQTIIVSSASTESCYYVRQIKLGAGCFCAFGLSSGKFSQWLLWFALVAEAFRISPNSDSNKIQAWICAQFINTGN